VGVSRGVHRVQGDVVAGEIVKRYIQVDSQLVTPRCVDEQFLIQGGLHVAQELEEYQDTYSAGADYCNWNSGKAGCLGCLSPQSVSHAPTCGAAHSANAEIVQGARIGVQATQHVGELHITQMTHKKQEPET